MIILEINKRMATIMIVMLLIVKAMEIMIIREAEPVPFAFFHNHSSRPFKYQSPDNSKRE